MQLSSFAGVPLLAAVLHHLGKNPALAVPYWLIFSFTAALIIILYILRKEFRNARLERKGSSIGGSIVWAIAGVFIALFAQTAAANIEHLFGVPVGSNNTQAILKIIEEFPLAVLVSSIIGPILEEIVFRKILFGALYGRFNFFVAALISSVIFALAHQEPQHILLYASMGFTFAYLYVKTKHIVVPIFAHTAMNTFVVLIQIVFRGDIEKMSQTAHGIQNFIGGFL
jgi:membrane protease YdiL (CAAX protease family)